MISANRVTHLGYAAVVDSKEHLVQLPKTLQKIPTRISAGIGAVYFASSLALLEAGGVSAQYILPMLGIVAALAVFVYQTITLVSGWKYRRRLKTYAKRGMVVFVPLALVQYIESKYQKVGQVMHPAVFDVDLDKTTTLVELYKQQGFSPEVKKIAQSLC